MERIKRTVIPPLVVLSALLILGSCRAHKTMASATYTDYAQTLRDTAEVVADTASSTLSETDTASASLSSELDGLVEFVEGGGRVSIDSAGNVALEGVRSIRVHHADTATLGKASARQTDNTAAHSEHRSATASDTTAKSRQTEQTAPAQKWHERALARLGLGVCIAFLMWLLFLYLRRKT